MTNPLPDIPEHPRVGHTLTGNVICGGLYPGTSDNCLELKSDGSGWHNYITPLTEYRMAHSSWNSPEGIVLLGGYGNPSSTAELVTRTCTVGGSCTVSSSRLPFTLQNEIR